MWLDHRRQFANAGIQGIANGTREGFRGEAQLFVGGLTLHLSPTGDLRRAEIRDGRQHPDRQRSE
jgi:hypothetical protein